MRPRQEIDKVLVERVKMTDQDVPEGIKPHAADYKAGSWTNYTLEELGQWIALFCKRSSHRSNLKKRAKDLHDARNYLSMMDSQLCHLEDQLYETLFLYDPQLVEEGTPKVCPDCSNHPVAAGRDICQECAYKRRQG